MPDFRVAAEAVDQCQLRLSGEVGQLRDAGSAASDPHGRATPAAALADLDGGFGAALGAFRDRVTAELGAAGDLLDGVSRALITVGDNLRDTEAANRRSLSERD